MPIDSKYGRVTLEKGNIGEDEPVVVFRARDTLLPNILSMYHIASKVAGSPQKHLDRINAALDEVLRWQRTNPHRLAD